MRATAERAAAIDGERWESRAFERRREAAAAAGSSVGTTITELCVRLARRGGERLNANRGSLLTRRADKSESSHPPSNSLLAPPPPSSSSLLRSVCVEHGVAAETESERVCASFRSFGYRREAPGTLSETLDFRTARDAASFRDGAGGVNSSTPQPSCGVERRERESAESAESVACVRSPLSAAMLSAPELISCPRLSACCDGGVARAFR
ncbi:unnamed protein product [Lampetra fluviatilis]